MALPRPIGLRNSLSEAATAAVTSVEVDRRQQVIATCKAEDILVDVAREVPPLRDRWVGDVRSDQDARLVSQRVAVGQRLRIGHVERGAGNCAASECRHQRVGVDQRPARDVDQPRALAHRVALGRADQVTGARGADAAKTTWSATGNTSPRRSAGSVPSRPLRVSATISTLSGSSSSMSVRPTLPAPTIATSSQPVALPSALSSLRPAPSPSGASCRQASARVHAPRLGVRRRRRPKSRPARRRRVRSMSRHRPMAAAPTGCRSGASRETNQGSNPAIQVPWPGQASRSDPLQETASSIVGSDSGATCTTGCMVRNRTPAVTASVRARERSPTIGIARPSSAET